MCIRDRVRIFYDDMGSIGFINTDFVKKMEAIGIHCRVFNPFMPGLNLFFHHIGEKAFDGTLRERRVVARHVFGEFVDADGFCYYWSRIILAIRFLDCLVLVLR